MHCENNFCIYCNKCECILDKINIDSIGLCTECILIDLDKDIINKEKKKLLSSYEE